MKLIFESAYLEQDHPDVIERLRAGAKIDAIKMLREKTDMSLPEALRACESWLGQNPKPKANNG